ncbi:S8 family serine peptidase [Streptomyces sp. NPDC059868]|uniref:S8 family serine peptidase n=1 Tax=unclassified Streptomyces TaxID=2593676 RepID=UPI0009A1090D|nr:S8 family serine peptidase [Streptomyces sp. TSRI0107]
MTSERGRRVRAAGGALVGALAVVVTTTTGLAPNAAAADAQSKQWYLKPMQAERMWKVSTGEGVKVAVIDTGVNADTPSLKGQVLVDEVPEAVDYRTTDDYTGDGTTVAELIAGTGAGGGLKGLAPGAKIVPYRVELDALQVGAKEQEKTPDLSDAITAAADTDAKIINLSLTWKWVTGNDEAAIEYAASKGKLVIASVGIGEERKVGFPSDRPYVVGVTSSDSSGTVSKGTAQGYADLAAPGEKIPRWCDETFRSYCVGEPDTRTAAALASASAALIWSAHPDWTVNQVTRSLIDTAGRSWAKDDPSRYAGYGLVRPRKVLENADYDPGPADVDPLAKENGGDLLADSAAENSSAPDDDADRSSAEASVVEASATPFRNHYHPLWLSLSAAATVIGLATTGIAVLRLRQERGR